MSNQELNKQAAIERERQIEEAYKVAASRLKEALDGYEHDLVKEASITLSDVIEIKQREPALTPQITEVDSSLRWNSVDSRIVEFPPVQKDTYQLYGGATIKYLSKAIKVPLADYADAEIGSYGSQSISIQRHPKLAYFPMIRIQTPKYEWIKEDMAYMDYEWLKNKIELDIENAIGYLVDKIFLKNVEAAMAKATALGYTVKVISANTIAQREDWANAIKLLHNMDIPFEKFVCHEDRKLDIFSYEGTELGQQAGDVFKQGNAWTETIAGYKATIALTSPIVKAGNKRIYGFAPSKFLGKFYDLGPITVKTSYNNDNDTLKVWAERYCAFGIANIKGVVAVDFA